MERKEDRRRSPGRKGYKIPAALKKDPLSTFKKATSGDQTIKTGADPKAEKGDALFFSHKRNCVSCPPLSEKMRDDYHENAK